MTTNIHEYAPWHKDRFYVCDAPYSESIHGDVGRLFTEPFDEFWLPVLTADEFNNLPEGAVVVRNCAGHDSHLHGYQVARSDGQIIYPVNGIHIDGAYALKSLPANQPDSGYVATADEEGLVEEPVAKASSKPWLDGVTPWQFAMLLEVMSIEDDCSAPCSDVDGLLERSWRYLQKARGEA